MSLIDLKNIGESSAAMLRNIGIESREDLCNLGAPAAYRLIKSQAAGVTVLMLYALQGAIEARHWNSFSDAEKAILHVEAEGFRFADE